MALLALPLECAAAGDCASTLATLRTLLRDEALHLEWRETTMDDGKPLMLSILERQGVLVLVFVKSGEGLWAEGASVVCAVGSGYEARFVGEDLRTGPAAGWVARYALASGVPLALTRAGRDELRIATAGWSGTFLPRK